MQSQHYWYRIWWRNINKYSEAVQIFEWGVNTLPKNAFFCKSVCGVGGTFLSIESDENYVIAVGSVELIYNKTQQHKNLLGVYGNFKIKDIEFYIVMCKLFGFPIKIMTTYDSLWKVTEALKDSGKESKLSFGTPIFSKPL